MRGLNSRRFIGMFALLLAASTPMLAQEPGSFYWINFHSPKDQSIVVWVTRSLAVENWTAIREIGVMYDAALVVTTDRATPQSSPNADTFNVWSVSLTSHAVTPLLKGVNLRWLDPLRFVTDAPLEPAILYDNCRQCAANTYFTTFHYDIRLHQWEARWTNGGEGVAVWNSSHPPGMQWTQVYAVMTSGNGIAHLVTWNHFDYGRGHSPEDSIYQYDVDPFSGLDRTVMQAGKQADAMKIKLCTAQDAVTGLARGQDSQLCQDLLHHPGRLGTLRGVPARRLAPPHQQVPAAGNSKPAKH